MAKITVNYYAGLVDRLGLSKETYEGIGTAKDLREAIVSRHGAAVEASVLSSSLLTEVGSLEPEDSLTGIAVVEVLPPFAGG